MRIDVNKAAAQAISPLLFGIFYEDIGYSADGGMSCNLVQNGNFQSRYLHSGKAHPIIGRRAKILNNPYCAWKLREGSAESYSMEFSEEQPFETANPRHAVIEAEKGLRLINTGYFPAGEPTDYGMGVFEGKRYRFSCVIKGAESGEIAVSIVKKGDGINSEAFTLSYGAEWARVSCVLTATATTNGALMIEFTTAGRVELDFVRLDALDSVWNKENPGVAALGLRTDLMQALCDLKPRFMRFPGGCIVEGIYTLANTYDWKNTVLPREQRQGTPNLWGYYQSYDIGFYEYFVICEEIGASAVPMISAGLVCQCFYDGRNAKAHVVKTPELFRERVVDYAIDLIYFAKGNVDSQNERERKWASLRAERGHSAPFKMQHIGIGNENWGKAYQENFDAVYKALQNADGRNLLEDFDVRLVLANGITKKGQMGGTNGIWRYVYGTSGAERDVVVDEHYYCEPSWFLGEGNTLYDGYDRKSAKVFISEYATHVKVKKGGRTLRPAELNNTMYSAVCEAVFMTAIERNWDVIEMASYAPLFAKIASDENPEKPARWYPNLIWFNNKFTMRTPNYYVQQLFMHNSTGRYVPCSTGKVGVYSSCLLDEAASEVVIKLINTEAQSREVSVTLENCIAEGTTVWSKLSGEQNAANHIDNRADVTENVSIVTKRLLADGNKIIVQLDGYSVNVIRAKIKTMSAE